MNQEFYRSGHRPTWAEVRLDRLVHNYQLIKQHVGPKVQVMAMIKANAYGHGATPVALRLEQEANADWFGVATPEEGLSLRRAGVTRPILCLGGFWHGQEPDLLDHQLTTTIFRFDMLESLNSTAKVLGKRARIHVKVDSGMGRLGIQLSELEEFLQTLSRCSFLELEGVLTHFAAADDPDKHDFTLQQIARYQTALEIFSSQGLTPPLHHLCNSAGTHAFPEAYGNLVRVGGMFYGIAQDSVSPLIPLLPVVPALSLHSRIILLKTLSSGHALGYGCTYTTTRTSQIATIPIGYADGVCRAHSNHGDVLVRGHRAPIVGRVSMDLTLIDVTDVPGVTLGDQVTLIGEQEGKCITAEEYANRIQTIALEVTTSLSERVPRLYL